MHPPFLSLPCHYAAGKSASKQDGQRKVQKASYLREIRVYLCDKDI
ncbi:MAG: hypothetical protein WGN25_05635 [Candidatus Electrothrix sp. GW3-4]